MDLNTKSKVFSYGIEKFSAYQPIDVKPLFGRQWVTNGVNNINFKIYKDAYDDSPTNSSIINSYASYIFGDGIDGIAEYLSDEDLEKAVLDLYTYGGCSFQIIWNLDGTRPIKMEYMPIFKLGVNYNGQTQEVTGYWYSYDWNAKARYRPTLYPKFTGKYVAGQNLEILYIRRPTSETFFPIPVYLSGLYWAKVEGEIANAGYQKYKNGMDDITIINSNNGMIANEEEAVKEADKLREKVVGTNNNGKVIVSINESLENALTIDRIAPPEMAQHNVFYSEEAERKLIVAHSAPPVIFAGSNSGNGFSSNADERQVAMQDVYRKTINPYRKTMVNGLLKFFTLVGIDVLTFKDFEANKELKKETTDGTTP